MHSETSRLNLEQQLQFLIHQAPQDGQTPQAIKKIGPILQHLAASLEHLSYHIWQSPQGNWEVTTLQNRYTPTLEKKVIVAYGSPTQAQPVIPENSSNRVLAEMPVLDLLFQLLALDPIDSLVFVPTASDKPPQEISRQELQALVFAALQPPSNLA